MLILFQIPAAKIYNYPRTKWVKNQAGVLPIFINLCIDSPPLCKNRRRPFADFYLEKGTLYTGSFSWGNLRSLRSCPPPIIPKCLSREEGMIHLFVGSHVKKPESGLFSDWIGNNTDDLRCSKWPICRHPFNLRSGSIFVSL